MKIRRIVLLSLIWVFLLPVFEEGQRAFPQPAELYRTVQQHPCLLDLRFQDFVSQYEEWWRAQLEREGVPGAAVAIVKSGALASIQTHGWRDLITRQAVDEHTVFRVASLSKGFTGLLASKMVQDSMIDWTSPLCEWVPGIQFKEPGYDEQLQIQHLLSHTTGLPRHTYSNLLNMGRSYRNILSLLPLVEPAHPVGTYHSYQNVTFNLAGDMLSGAANTPFATLMADHIFTPLGMQDASLSYEQMMLTENRALPCKRIANGYAPDQLEPDYYAVPAAAGVNASIHDMAKYLKFVMGHYPEVAGQEVLDQAFQPYSPIPAAKYMHREWRPFEAAHYAMGWRIIEKAEYTIITHSGYVNGYRAEIAFCPEEDAGIVMLSNAPNYTVGSATPAFFHQYFQEYANCQPTI